MKLIFLSVVAFVGFSSCADEKARAAGPVSNSSQIPWNAPISGQGGGQFSMLPQNQYRR